MQKRKDANDQEENHNLDTRRFLAEDDNGHIIGSHQAASNEQDTEALRRQEDDSAYNQLDDRGTEPDSGRSDL